MVSTLSLKFTAELSSRFGPFSSSYLHPKVPSTGCDFVGESSAHKNSSLSSSPLEPRHALLSTHIPSKRARRKLSPVSTTQKSGKRDIKRKLMAERLPLITD
jgi:hypothetical protein